MPAKSSLEAAMGGQSGTVQKLSDKETRSALNEAVQKLSRATRNAQVTKEAVLNTGTALMHTAETMGSAFMSSMAEGYLGPEKLTLGGVDLRAPAGLALQGVGLYSLLTGKGGGEHYLAVGNGISASWLASVGRDAGHALRLRGPAMPAPAPGAPYTAGYGPGLAGPLVSYPALTEGDAPLPVPALMGPPREILLTPEAQVRPTALVTPSPAPETDLEGEGERMERRERMRRLEDRRERRQTRREGGGE